MDRILVSLLPLTLLAFWAWMFGDMVKNENLPGCFITFTSGRDPRFDWNVAFVFLSIVAAVFYYFNG
ncbi:MAG: hypothetical protein ACM3QS_09490 [Bacteroidota bacterium]